MENDPVVCEIPVFLSKNLEGLLHVFSFPLRSEGRPYEASAVELDVTELNPQSSSTSDNANDPRKLNLYDNTAPTPGSKKHHNADKAIVGVRPRFTMQMSFDTRGDLEASFAGNEPIANNKGTRRLVQTTGHVSNLGEDIPFGTVISQEQYSHVDDDNNNIFGESAFLGGGGSGILGMGGGGNMMGRGGGNNNNSEKHVYRYKLESTPAPQHSSYCAALFSRNGLHLTPITGVHQFFPKTQIDRNLEVTLSDPNGGGSGVGGGLNASQGNTKELQNALSALYQPKILPRSVALARSQIEIGNDNENGSGNNKTNRGNNTGGGRSGSFLSAAVGSSVAGRRRPLDYMSSDHCDSVPVVNALFGCDASTTVPELPEGAVEASRTAAQLARSSSDPSRDEDEMMWGLQAFFPFIDSAPEHEQMIGNGNSQQKRSALAHLQSALASGKSNIALKFAHQAMGIDEQVSAVVTGAKLATCEDLQRHVMVPNSHEPVSIHRLVQALRRVSVCVHGVWCSLWDPLCSGVAAFVREFLFYCFAVSEDASVSARELFNLCGEGEPGNENNASFVQLRKVIRSVLPIVADLNQNTKRWTLKNYDGGKHSAVLDNYVKMLNKGVKDQPQQDQNDVVKQQREGWAGRKELVISNMRSIGRGEVLARTQLALRAVAAAGMAALRGQQLSSIAGQQQQQQGGALSSQQIKAQIHQEELNRVRNFIRSAFEMHGVINKGLFRERILQMQRTRESLVFAVPKELLQEGLRDELQGFTESTWILKQSTDPTTSLLRPYFIRAILEKKTFTTKEVEQLAFQMIRDDPNQNILNRSGSTSPSSAASASSVSGTKKNVSDAAVASEIKQEEGTTDESGAAGAGAGAAVAAGKKTQQQQNNNYITISLEHHQIAVRLIGELATFHRAEKMWHIKSGIVQFLAIA